MGAPARDAGASTPEVRRARARSPQARGAPAVNAVACPPEVRPPTRQSHAGPRCAPRTPLSDNRRTMMMICAARAPNARGARTHPCVVGLRARLKPERFWFDSRGWDHHVAGWIPARASGNARPRRIGSKTGLHLVLTQATRRFESDPIHVTSHRTQPRAPTVVRASGAARSTAKQVRRGDRSVRHTGFGGFDSHHLLDLAHVAQRSCSGPVNRAMEVRLFSWAPSAFANQSSEDADWPRGSSAAQLARDVGDS